MTPRPHALALLLLALAGACSSAPGPVPEQVQSDVRKLMTALYSWDVDTVVAYTHPAVLVKLGGAARVHDAIADVCKRMQEHGAKLESLSFPKPPDFLQADERWFAIVPTRSVTVADGQRVESTSFQFGVIEPGADRWTWFDGSRVESTDVPRLFAGFPLSYRFPPVTRRKL